MTTFEHDDMPPGGGGADADRFLALIVASDDGAAADAMRAVELAGGRVLRRVDWAQAARAIEELARRAIVLVEALSVDGSVDGSADDTAADVLGTALPGIDRQIAAMGLPVIVALGDWQIDIVSASLLEGRALV